MTSGNVSDRLARRISGGGSRSRSSAQVRYTAFPEGRHESNVRTRTSKRRSKGMIGPSGSHYRFRQKAGGSKSQWINVHDSDDLEYFEESDEFEVRWQ